MSEIKVPGLYYASSALRNVVQNWEDWSDAGLWMWSNLVKAAVLTSVLEDAWVFRVRMPWRQRVRGTDEFVAWVENWLAK